VKRAIGVVLASLLLVNASTQDIDFRPASAKIGATITPGPGANAPIERSQPWHRTHLPINVTGANSVTLADGSHGASVLLASFPLGANGSTFILSASFAGTITNTSGFSADPADTFSFGFGTAAAADDATLTGSETSLTQPVQTIDTASGTVTTRPVATAVARCDAWCNTFPGQNAKIYANFAINAANNSTANTFTVTGTLEIIWMTLTAPPGSI
jgi:hypothetical protein